MGRKKYVCFQLRLEPQLFAALQRQQQRISARLGTKVSMQQTLLMALYASVQKDEEKRRHGETA